MLLQQLAIPAIEDASLRDFLELESLQKKVQVEVCEAARQPSACIPFLSPGRVVRVSHEGIEWGWGAVVAFTTRTRPPPWASELPPRSSPDRFVVDVVMWVLPSGSEGGQEVTGVSPVRWEDATGVAAVVPMSMKMLGEISAVRVYLGTDLQTQEALNAVMRSVQDAVSAFPGGMPPMLDVCADMGVNKEGMNESVRRLADLTKRVHASPWAHAHKECLAFEVSVTFFPVFLHLLYTKNHCIKLQD